MRSLAREVVFKYIFSRLFNQGDEGLFDILLVSEKLNNDDRVFADSLLKAVDKKIDDYFDLIGKMAVGYKLTRVINADKCAIVIGMAEMDEFKATPIPVVINEAVNLASKYSTEKSADFVNGILAAYAEGKY